MTFGGSLMAKTYTPSAEGVNYKGVIFNATYFKFNFIQL